MPELQAPIFPLEANVAVSPEFVPTVVGEADCGVLGTATPEQEISEPLFIEYQLQQGQPQDQREHL
jgi:hypothetical protein